MDKQWKNRKETCRPLWNIVKHRKHKSGRLYKSSQSCPVADLGMLNPNLNPKILQCFTQTSKFRLSIYFQSFGRSFRDGVGSFWMCFLAVYVNLTLLSGHLFEDNFRQPPLTPVNPTILTLFGGTQVGHHYQGWWRTLVDIVPTSLQDFLNPRGTKNTTG